ncbi:site-specific DNA-methyltransferase [Aestuariivirga litoralis]|uniref:site-specific DNA-methyltransferase n=1 Tax=Aestuariivirga litoralis TaxID=2650924 RepID=UPI0018C4E64F|nr:DNA methyltransferase [Aestuariivirga litoralis]MBG1233487.1 DNA methylase N-4 [Aestuariivirga litoralis]
MPGLQIESIKLESLVLNPRNARTHSRRQIQQIAKSIRSFGFASPVLIDENNVILAGHGRLTAAKELQLAHVPCIRLAHLNLTQKKALALADNRIALDAGWDEELLAQELKDILTDATFDITDTGFTLAEIDGVIEGLGVDEAGDPRDERLPALDADQKVTQKGDVWILGRHRLICGDALDPEVVETLMAGDLAQMVFADPPYNVKIANVSGLGKTEHPEFAMASGEMAPEQFTSFLETAFRNLVKHSIDGSIHFVCMDWRHQAEISEAGKRTYSELKNVIVWDKINGGMGSFYRSRHELIYAFKNGTAPHINNFGLGQRGRYRTNVWAYRGMNSFGAGRDAALESHPTVKPVAMIADAIKDVSGRGGIVLDLFGGSGSTLIAAEKAGRRGFLCELNEAYCDLIIRRYQACAKDDATLVSTGETFDQRRAMQLKIRNTEPGAAPAPRGSSPEKLNEVNSHD